MATGYTLKAYTQEGRLAATVSLVELLLKTVEMARQELATKTSSKKTTLAHFPRLFGPRLFRTDRRNYCCRSAAESGNILRKTLFQGHGWRSLA